MITIEDDSFEGVSAEDTRSLRGMSVGQLRALESVLVRRMDFSRRAGLSFDDKRDMNKALGYPDTIVPQDYHDRYERGGIATRIVEAYPKAVWRGRGTVFENEESSGDETPFEKAWESLNKRLHFWRTFERVDILSGLGHYSGLLIGAPGENLREPLAKGNPSDLRYVTPLSELNLEFTEDDIEQDVTKERFAHPNFYSPVSLGISRKTSNTTKRNPESKIHWSRIIHVAENILEGETLGKPILRSVWNYLNDLEKIVGAGAEAFWQKSNPGMQLDMDPEMELDADEESALNAEIQEYLHNITRVMRTRGITLKQLALQVATFDANVQSILTLISGATGIPSRILTGSERGELASTQDRANWNERVDNRRINFAEPVIIGAFVNRCMEFGYLPRVDSFGVRWPQLDHLDDKERAAVAERYASINQRLGTRVFLTNEIRVVAGHAPSTEADSEAVGEPIKEAAPGVDSETGEPLAAPGENNPSMPSDDANTIRGIN